ncbi:hypothetical protein [Deefgea piscis]|uniref:hypothetical protein n=1 Tax=Deefgea piscis TaxID=2739061 RepID=UPI001C8010D9|nr:hypothetical protein [Deefgea piscis]QZA79630.1 hypothetical protein K4H25_08620 [Deefgea piscis]
MSQNTINLSNSKRKFVRWRAAIIPKHHTQAFEGKITEANADILTLISATEFKAGSEARLMLEVHEYLGMESNRNTLDLTGKFINSALIGHVSVFRHQFQLHSLSYQQQQLLNKLTNS